MVKYRAAFVIAAVLLAASGCSRSSEAIQQDEYKKKIETDIITKFIDKGPLTDSKSVLFAVVRADAGDKEALACTYSTKVPDPSRTVAVRVFRIESEKPNFHILAKHDAHQILDEASTEATETYPLSEILSSNGNVKWFEPFPMNEKGVRIFLFSGCTE